MLLRIRLATPLVGYDKSLACQKNGVAMPTHKLHTAGSISFGEHKRRKLKRRVSFLEVYDDVHKKKSGEYVSEVSKKIIDLYGETISQKYGEDLLDQPEVDPDVWTEVAGTKKKGQKCAITRRYRCFYVKPVSQADITEAIKETLPSAINAVLSSVLWFSDNIPTNLTEDFQRLAIDLLQNVTDFRSY
ncbi:hypothetical protein Ahy_B01g055822 [Arachis hypogaea]|uniref:Uncharacterized protein n=1 Tax=Arachis hypogaea TaxID=3818 RepID=A0A445AX69_ARAHY|nr:hypothetical protein Ahy_B01g055822 [Arachis hypogaea]